MARLTWQDVAGPNMGSTFSGLRVAGDSFNQGMQGLSAAIGRAQGLKTDAADRELQLRVQQQRDLGTLDQMLANGTLYEGINKRDLSSGAIASAGGAFDRLVSSRTNEGDLNWANQVRGWASDDRGNRIEAAGLLAEAQALEDAGKLDEAAAIRSQVSDVGLDLGDMKSFMGQDASNRQNFRNFRDTDYDYGRGVRADNIKDAAQLVLAEAQSYSTTDGRAAFMNQNRENMPPEVFNYAMEKLGLGGTLDGGAGGGGYAGGAGGGMPVGGNTDPYNTRFGHDKFTPPPKPLTEMTLGEVYDYGQNVLRPETRAAGFGKLNGKVVGTSAVGAYQFVGGTLEKYAEKVLGPNWRNETFTPEVQDKMAEMLFNDQKNGNLQQTWEGLPDATPGAYKDKTWAEMRDLIFQHEVGAPPPSLRQQATDMSVLDTGTGNAQTAVSAGIAPISQAYYEYDSPEFQELSVSDAYGLIKDDENISQFGSTRVQGMIQEAMTKAQSMDVPMNAAQAAMVVKNSIEDQGFLDNINIFSWGRTIGGYGTGDDRLISRDAIERNIKIVGEGLAEGQRNASTQVRVTEAEVSGALQAAQQAQQLAQQAASRGARDAPALAATARQAWADYEMVKAGAGNSSTMQSFQSRGDGKLVAPTPAPAPASRPNVAPTGVAEIDDILLRTGSPLSPRLQPTQRTRRARGGRPGN